jgi:hypothetical protein
MTLIDRHLDKATLLLALLATTRVRLIPNEVTAIELIPFCSFVGGLAGAYCGAILNGKGAPPRRESLRGAGLGALFGLLFIFFGVVDA